MNGDRIVHGPEAEARRLYAYEGQNRSAKRHLSPMQAGFVIGLLLGAFVGAVSAVLL